MTARDDVLNAAKVLAARSEDETFTLAELLQEVRRSGSQYKDSTIRGSTPHIAVGIPW